VISPIRAFARSLRPHQWIKNAFVFAGVFFSGRFLEVEPLIQATLGFVAFCFLSSGVYLLNDIVDIDSDRAHPQKSRRPIASGEISIPIAMILSIMLFAVGTAISFFVGMSFFYFVLGYIGLQLLYIFFLKRQPILDILAVSAGFVIRAAAGGFAVDVPISSWLLVCTSLLALFLVTGKRRQELARIEANALDSSSRPLLANYSVAFLDMLIVIEVSATLVAYMFYVFSAQVVERFGGYQLGLTLPFVFYGLFRYLWLVFQKNEGESPERIFLTDIASIINIILWGITVFSIIYIT